MKYVYLLIFCTLITLIFSFRNYKKDSYASLSKKEAPLKILYGFSMLLISLSTLVNKEYSSTENLSKKLKAISVGISAFSILIFLGLMYSFSTSVPAAKSSSNQSQLSTTFLNEADTDSSNSIVNSETSEFSMENEEYNQIKESIAIFEKYREDIEKAFLGENESYLSITHPLNLISEYGEEGILISWSFETENVIDSEGNIIYDNIGEEGCSTLAYATLTLNDTSATLTIPICISPP